MPTLTTQNTIDTKFSQAAAEEDLQLVKTSLEDKGFSVEVVDSLPDARKVVENLIPDGSEVFTATSVTLDKSGLSDALNSGPYVSVREKFMALADRPVDMRRMGSGSDYAVGSVHAVTQDGQVLIASASGSQLPNYAYGASHVVWVVGSQKIVTGLDEAIERIEKYTFHLEDERAKKAYGSGSSINKILIVRKDPANRTTVVLVREPVGF